jgi:hypothetical protein
MLNVIYLYFWRVYGHARGHVLPADSGRGRILLPVADSGHGRGHENTVTGADLRYMYPRRFCPLPFVDKTDKDGILSMNGLDNGQIKYSLHREG